MNISIAIMSKDLGLLKYTSQQISSYVHFIFNYIALVNIKLYLRLLSFKEMTHAF
jgi:hypothetical protein